MKILLTKEQEELFRSGTVIIDKEKKEEFMYYPYWIRKNKDETFTILSFDNLPDNIKKLLKEYRKPK